MSWPLQEKFKDGPITQIPRSWFETVAKILNHIEGMGIEIEKSADPSETTPWRIKAESITEESVTTVPLHASTHMAAGVDPIRLDELKAPTDVATLNASTSAHGLLPKLPTADPTTKFLRGDGAWDAAPALGDGSATGQIFVWNHTASEWQLLSLGTEGQVLTSVSGAMAWADPAEELPAQTGNADKVLKTDGTDPSWVKILPANMEGTQASGGPTATRQAIVSGTLTGGVWSLAWTKVVAPPTDPGFPSGLVWWDQTNQVWVVGQTSGTTIPIAFLFAGSGVADRMLVFDADGDCTTAPISDYLGVGNGTATGQILKWNNTSGEWELLNIGSTGQILTVAAGAPAWTTPPTALPSGGSTSMVLQKASATDYDYEWDWVRTV